MKVQTRKLQSKLCSVFIVLYIAGGSLIAGGRADSLNSDDSDFLKKAAKGGMAEVELGNLALQKATRPEIKEFANMIIKDHTKANREVASLATAKGVDLPKGKGLSEDVVAAHLKMLSGKSFDDAYVKAMIDDHKEDIADFQKESESAKDPAVKKLATKMLPTLQTHLTKVQQIQSGK